MQARRVVAGVLWCAGIVVLTTWMWQIIRTPVALPVAQLEKISGPDKAQALAAPDLPNVVLLVGCTLRRDQLTVYAPDLDTTPVLSALAKRGTVFDDAIAAAPWTRAASAAIFTGEHPVSLGMVEPKPVRNDRRLPEHADTLAEQFQRAGYRTLGATTNPNLNEVYGFNQGFHTYWQPAALWRDDMTKLPGASVEKVLQADLPVAGPRPVYLQMLLVDAHSPYPELADLDRDAVSPDVPARVLRYRASVRGFDRAVGGIFGLLETRGYTLENTLFVVLSDHGEGLNYPQEHGKAHGRFVYPSSVRALWMMAGPGVPSEGRVGGVVSQVDVAPTVLALAGLLAPDGPGVNQVPALTTGESLRDAAYSDTWFLDVQRSAVYFDDVACQADFAVGHGAGIPQGCFDRRQDPAHEHAVVDAPRQAQLATWHEARVAEYLSADHGMQVEADEGVIRQLEALGYANP